VLWRCKVSASLTKDGIVVMQTSTRVKTRCAFVIGVPVLLMLCLAIGSLLPRMEAQAAEAAGSAPAGSVHSTQSTGDWTTYLGDNGRSGFNGNETLINATSAGQLTRHWSVAEGSVISTQPIVANGAVFWGSWDGMEHATNLSGQALWSANLGKTVDNNPNCNPTSVGVASTATVATVTIGGTATSVVFVGGGNAQFYALNALSGKVIWHTALGSSPSHFIWGSPAVYNGSVYIGVASFGDCPLVQGQLIKLNATTGVVQNRFNAEPSGCTGGTIWSSPSIDQTAGMLYIMTGNTGKCSTAQHYASALVQLRVSNLAVVSSWQLPASARKGDIDCPGAPTLFSAKIANVTRNLVGMICKNGTYNAFDRTAIGKGPLWQANIAISGNDPVNGEGSIAPATWDGTTLYVAGGNTTIGGTSCQGSVRALNPATGAFLWKACLKDGPVLGAVTAVPGVVAVGEGPKLVLLAMSSGQPLFTFTALSGSGFYGAASISHGVLYIGDTGGNLYAFGP
jgi:outer membrane protein assembly factor BamB